MTVEISYFSLASLAALVLFLAVMIPRAVAHLALVVMRARTEDADPWLLAIAAAFLFCGALGVGMAIYSVRAHSLVQNTEAVSLAFVLFAIPAVLQVLRAWRGKHARQAKAFSHGLVALAILSLPASMAIPTAALLQATVAAPGQSPPADNPAAAIANERFFTDNEVANDPEDYPVAAFLAQNLSLKTTLPVSQRHQGRNFYLYVPAFTAFWFDQTATVLTFDATDTFGVIISRLSHVRANFAFSLMVFLYKLMCAVVLVAVSFDSLLAPGFLWLSHALRRRRRSHPAAHASAEDGGTTEDEAAMPLEPVH